MNTYQTTLSFPYLQLNSFGSPLDSDNALTEEKKSVQVPENAPEALEVRKFQLNRP